MTFKTEDDLRRLLHTRVDPGAQERLTTLIGQLAQRDQPEAAARPPQGRSAPRAGRRWLAPVLAAGAVAAVAIVATVVAQPSRHSDAAGSATATASGPAVGSSAASANESDSAAASAAAAAARSVAAQRAQAAARARAGASVSHGTVADVSSYHTGRYGPTGPTQTMPTVVQFQMPSGNIACTAVADDDLVCDIDQFDFATAPRPAGCTHNWAEATVELTGNGSSTLGLCLGGPIVTDASTVLPYGHTLYFGQFACYSGSSALTCVSAHGGGGFSLSRQAFARF